MIVDALYSTETCNLKRDWNKSIKEENKYEEKQKDNAATQEEEAGNDIVISKISESLVASKVNYSINKCDNNDIVNWFE